MSVPESIAWLEQRSHDEVPSAGQIYATTLLGEITRLSAALESCAQEVDHLERLRHEAVTAQRGLAATLASLEEMVALSREQWDRDRTDLETRCTSFSQRIEYLEGVLKDAHHGLLKQSELSREDIAAAITEAVPPWPEGAR